MTTRKRLVNYSGKSMCYGGFRLGWTIGSMDDDVDMLHREPSEPEWYHRKFEAEQRIIRGTDSSMGSAPELAGDSLEPGVRENMAINNPFGLQ